jgi:hypothetical protein
VACLSKCMICLLTVSAPHKPEARQRKGQADQTVLQA